MTESNKTRIEEASSLIDYSNDTLFNSGLKAGYIIGAEAEHTRAWNEAVDACRIAITREQSGINHRMLEILELLKIKE
jgi:hypothetical protein